MLPKIALGVTGVFYLILSYYYLLDFAGLCAWFNYQLSPTVEVNGIITVLSRYMGIACFIFAFIFLHMIPREEKHQAALRTSTMVTACYAAAAGYRAFVEDGVSSMAVEATRKNFYIQGAFCALSVAAMLNAPDPKAKKA